VCPALAPVPETIVSICDQQIERDQIARRNNFKHVSSADNPADLATRYPKELTSSIWWMGPTWLSYPQEKWPISKIPECKTADVESEMKRNNVLFEASLLSREDLSQEIPELLDLSDINESRYSSLLWWN